MQQKSEELLRMIPGQFNILEKIRLQSMNVKSSLPVLYIELALKGCHNRHKCDNNLLVQCDIPVSSKVKQFLPLQRPLYER